MVTHDLSRGDGVLQRDRSTCYVLLAELCLANVVLDTLRALNLEER